jgi:thymidine phosphorylase
MDGKVVGLLGIGSENIVLEVKLPDGREMALRFTKRALGFHINEIPPQLTRRRIYKLEDVNQKLRSLVGNR